MDVTQSADAQRLVAKAVDQYGGLDYAFNNAGTVGSRTGIVDTTEEDWNRVIALNLTSVWLCMKYEIPEMLKRGGGAIVNNGSVSGLVGAPGAAANTVTKHGVHGLTKSAALRDGHTLGTGHKVSTRVPRGALGPFRRTRAQDHAVSSRLRGKGLRTLPRSWAQA